MTPQTGINIGPAGLPGVLALPEHPRGLILFAHGSGSSRSSPRNLLVAESLQRSGYVTILFDLLHEAEADDRRNVFNIPLLAARVENAVDWAREDDRTFDLPLGLFGASTGAAAALVAAAARRSAVSAVVSRGGRPDLAEGQLKNVHAPTLLLVGDEDLQVLALNRLALSKFRYRAKLTVIPRASHLFEEPGALDAVVAAATDWFDTYLLPLPVLFDDRGSAGRILAAALARRAPEDPVVYALPRGGAPVAAEIARKLGAPLDLILARKIGAPRQPELALGAAVDGEKPEIVLNDKIVTALRVSRAEIDRLAAAQFVEIERRRAVYLGAAPPISAGGRTAILVDDGIATGASMEAAIRALRRRAPRKIIVAVPIAARSTVERLGALVDEVVALTTPETFYGIGEFYRDFHQLDDAEVVALLSAFSRSR